MDVRVKMIGHFLDAAFSANHFYDGVCCFVGDGES